jgi:hypothetical protein
LKKWPLLGAFVAVGVIGCGGGGGGGNSTATGGTTAGVTTGTTGITTGTTGRATSSVNIPNRPGKLDVYLLPGQGRGIPYFTADVGHIDFTDAQGFITALENPVPPDLFLQLNGLNAQNRRVNAAVPAPGSTSTAANSRTFPSIALNFNEFLSDTGTGQVISPGFIESLPNTAFITSFQGRDSAVQIFLNDGMFNFGATVTFDPVQYHAQNDNPTTGKLTGFLSDYLKFDISHITNKPQLVNTPGPAQCLMVSGDNFALSEKVPAVGKTAGFEVLTPFGTFPGIFSNTDPTTGIKSYTLQQPDPTVFQFPPRMITALAGVYYDFTERVNVVDSTLMIAFPQTGDGAKQELVIVTSSGGVVSNLYFGTINYAAAGGPSFTAFPIGDIQPANTAGQITGTLGGLGVSTSVANWWQFVRSGTYTLKTGSGVPASGHMIVYRI